MSKRLIYFRNYNFYCKKCNVKLNAVTDNEYRCPICNLNCTLHPKLGFIEDFSAIKFETILELGFKDI